MVIKFRKDLILTSNDLLGEWTFSRVILDDLSATRFFAKGDLVLSTDSWCEKGSMNGKDFFCNYNLSLLEKEFSLYLTNNTHFFTIDDINIDSKFTHICLKDIYNGVWKLRNNKLIINWTVTGPRKNYSITTVYHKLN